MKNLGLSSYFIIAFTLVLSSVVNAQVSNTLLDRAYWKSQPEISSIKKSIQDGHSATAMTPFNFDATVYAILEDNPVATIEFLLSQGNDVNKITHDGRTYLFWAAYRGNVELMEYLISQGAKTGLVDQHGYTVLIFAAVTGQKNTAVYDYCIELGADIHGEKTRDGRNALLAYAGAMNDLSVLPYFIDKGLDINSTDENGNGVFNYAARTGNEALLKDLIQEYDVDYGINKSTNENAFIFATSRFSRSGAENSLAFYKYLESLGLDPTVITSSGNSALLNLASNAKDLTVFSYFIEKGVNVNHTDESGNNALIKSTVRNTLPVVEFLAAKTDDLNHVNEEGQTALTNALIYNKMDVVNLLYDEGARLPQTLGKEGDLGVKVINSFNGDLDDLNKRISFLEKNGYQPLELKEDGSTLLHAAIKKNDINLLKYFIEKGVDINAKDNDGQTVLHLAAMQAENSDVLKYLLSVGADKTKLTPFDESAYDLATQNEALAGNDSDLEFLK